MYVAKPGDLYQYGIINNTAGAADAVIANSILTFANVANGQLISMDWGRIHGFVRTAYAAGTAEVALMTTTSAVLVAGVVYTVNIRRTDTGQIISYPILASSTNVSTYKTAIITAINNDPSRLVTALSTGANTATLTQLVDTGGFTVTITGDTGTTIAYSTPYVFSSGTAAEVALYGTTLSASAQYCKYQFKVDVLLTGAGSGEGAVNTMTNVLWVESVDAQFAAFDAQLVSIMDGSIATTAALVMEYLAKI